MTSSTALTPPPDPFSEYVDWQCISISSLGTLARIRVPGGFLYLLTEAQPPEASPSVLVLGDEVPARSMCFVPFVHDPIDEERARASRLSERDSAPSGQSFSEAS